MKMYPVGNFSLKKVSARIHSPAITLSPPWTRQRARPAQPGRYIATGVGKTAVSEYVSRARVIGIPSPIPPEITDAELERRLFTPAGFHEGSTKQLPHLHRQAADALHLRDDGIGGTRTDAVHGRARARP
jgi:hypothetical protein